MLTLISLYLRFTNELLWKSVCKFADILCKRENHCRMKMVVTGATMQCAAPVKFGGYDSVTFHCIQDVQSLFEPPSADATAPPPLIESCPELIAGLTAATPYYKNYKLRAMETVTKIINGRSACSRSSLIAKRTNFLIV